MCVWVTVPLPFPTSIYFLPLSLHLLVATPLQLHPESEVYTFFSFCIVKPLIKGHLGRPQKYPFCRGVPYSEVGNCIINYEWNSSLFNHACVDIPDHKLMDIICAHCSLVQFLQGTFVPEPDKSQCHQS